MFKDKIFEFLLIFPIENGDFRVPNSSIMSVSPALRVLG